MKRKIHPPTSTLVSDLNFRDFNSGKYVSDYMKFTLSRLVQLVPYFNLKPTDKVLDLACGPCQLLDLIHNKVGEYEGVDFSAGFISLAKERASKLGITNGKFECSEITEFCRRRSGYFDTASALDCVPQFGDEHFVSIFSSLHGALKPGGKLYIHTPPILKIN